MLLLEGMVRVSFAAEPTLLLFCKVGAEELLTTGATGSLTVVAGFNRLF